MAGLPQVGTPFLDGQGRVSRVWWLFLQELFNLSGANNGASSNDLALSLPEDAGIEELKLDGYRLRDEMNTAPPGAFSQPASEDPGAIIESLSARMDQLAADLEALKQGTQP